jgi:hypothetical protein
MRSCDGSFSNGLCCVQSEIWYASVAAGTSGTITVNYNASFIRTGLALYRILTSAPTPGTGANNNALTSRAPVRLYLSIYIQKTDIAR